MGSGRTTCSSCRRLLLDFFFLGSRIDENEANILFYFLSRTNLLDSIPNVFVTCAHLLELENEHKVGFAFARGIACVCAPICLGVYVSRLANPLYMF